MRRTKRFIILGLISVGMLLYAFNMGNALFWDDADWITNNPCVQEPLQNIGCLFTRDVLAGIGQTSNYFRPVLMMTFAVNWFVGGEGPFGYHLASNGLHIANAVLLFLLLVRLFKDVRVAGVASFLWLIHPLQTEAVAYISGRGDPLSLFFMLGGLLSWLYVFRWHRVVAYLCAILAVLSRETAVLFPVYLMLALLVIDYKDSLVSSLRRILKEVWPFFGISAVYGVLRMTVFNFANTLNWHAVPSDYTEHISYRVYTFLQVLWEYTRLMIAPIGLHMERDVPVMTSLWHHKVVGGALVLAALLTVSWYLWRRGNRLWAWAVGMFLIPLIPSSGILAPINARIYEHWLYISLIGFALLVAVYGVQWYDALRARFRGVAVAMLIGVFAYAGFLSIQTIQRNILWGQPERFYLHILSYEPSNARVLNNLANIYAEEGKKDDAERYWRVAIEVDKNQPAPYHNIGNLYRDRGDVESALEWYEKAITVQPSFWYSYQNMASLLLQNRRIAEAVPVLLAWQRVDLLNITTYYTLAQIYGATGMMREARAMLDAGRPAARAAGVEAERAFEQLYSQLQ